MKPPPRTAFANRRGLWIVLALAVAGVTLLAGYSLRGSRRLYRQEAAIATQNLCTLLANGLASSFQMVDLAVLGVKEEIEHELQTGGAQPERVEALIRQRLEHTPALFGLRAANAAGIIDRGVDRTPSAPISIADRSYFQRLQSDPQAGLVFSEPVQGRMVRRWVIMLARRINAPDGSFGGVVYGAIDLEHLRALYDSLSLGRAGVVILRDPEQKTVVRRGATDWHAGESTATPEYLARVRQGQTSGTLTYVSAADGEQRLYSYARVAPYGYYVSVGISERDILAPWWGDVRGTVALAAGLLALVGLALWRIDRAWVWQKQAEAEREKVIEQLQEALAEVKVLGGLLPICSHCKKIRDDRGYWNKIEAYLSRHTAAKFTHSICPDCLQKHYADYVPARDEGTPPAPGRPRGERR